MHDQCIGYYCAKVLQWAGAANPLTTAQRKTVMNNRVAVTPFGLRPDERLLF
jgi:hypothetical protein